MKRILVLLLLAVLLCVGVSAAAEGNAFKFDPNVNTVFEGETLQMALICAGIPAEGELTFQSANENVATVDGNGVVTGISKGRVTITALSKTEKKTYKAQLNIAIARKAASVEPDTSKLSVYEAGDPALEGLLNPEGEALQVLAVPVKKRISLPAEVMPKDASNRKLVYATADETIAAVRGNTITGVSSGETVVTVASVSNPEVQIRFRVLVVQPVTRLTLEPRNPVVAKGGRLGLTAALQPEDATLQKITWTSANEKIATVDANGVVTGVAKGNVRIIASAEDGSNIRANISVRVTQPAEEITLDKDELTLDIGRTGVLRGKVLPANTDDKSVIWSSSDENIATVNRQGRITAVSLGTCTITCASAATEGVSASAAVTVQQPVTKIIFGDAPVVYADASAKLTWSVEPENATNPAVTFTSGNPKVLTVAEDGTVTGIRAGEATITAVSTDGSNRRARINVKVLVHATGVHMYRNTAYVNVGESATCRAVLEPREAGDTRMTWTSDNENVAVVSGEANRVTITGVSEGITRITGTLADGGHQASMEVRIGQWDKSIKLTGLDVDGRANVEIKVRNVSDLDISSVTCEMECFVNGQPVAINTKDGSNRVKVTYRHMLYPGNYSRDNTLDNTDNWVFEDYEKPADYFDQIIVRVVSFQVDRDWIKSIRTRNQPRKEWRH